jgi:hypothetical protein
MAAHRYVGSLSFAFVHLALGENEKAFDDLERACREPATPMSSISRSSRYLIRCVAIHVSSF